MELLCDAFRFSADAPPKPKLLSLLLGGLFRFPVSFLCQLECFSGVFQGLPGMFLPGFMVFFAVVRRSRTVRVGGQIVQFRGSIVHIFWHSIFSWTAKLIVLQRSVSVRVLSEIESSGPAIPRRMPNQDFQGRVPY
jgi:hypothetical protein